jgi:hypothetical protein
MFIRSCQNPVGRISDVAASWGQQPIPTETDAWPASRPRSQAASGPGRRQKLYHRLRSYIETARKHFANPFNILNRLSRHDARTDYFQRTV